jgi:hypothetical protein
MVPMMRRSSEFIIGEMMLDTVIQPPKPSSLRSSTRHSSGTPAANSKLQ